VHPDEGVRVRPEGRHRGVKSLEGVAGRIVRGRETTRKKEDEENHCGPHGWKWPGRRITMLVAS
jgi:hypothetical protein